MLHILLSVLKITGIIIAAILGILVLLICIVLFVPIRYEVKAKCDGTMDTLKVKGAATWILHLIRADFYFKEKKLKWKLRLAWLKKSNQAVNKKRKEVEPNEEIEKSETVEKTVKEAAEEIPETETGEKSNETVQQKEPETPDEKDKIIHSKTSDRIPGTEEECKNEKETLHQKIEKLIDKIKCTFHNICDKIKAILEKKEKLVNFIKDDIHVAAFQKTKKVLFRMLKRLKPKKTDIRVNFGFEDPYVTGQVLAGLSMIYPFIGGVTEVYPDFEHKILKGTIHLKGKLRLWHVVYAAAKLLLCNAVRVTYKDIKNFKL